MEDADALEAFNEIFPDKENISFSVRYNSRMKPYGAQIAYSRVSMAVEFRLGRGWLRVSPAIKKGLFQELMVKIFRKKGEKIKSTMEMEVYCNFIRNLHLSIGKEEAEPVLEESFARVNKNYFGDIIEKPNMRFLGKSQRRLAKYDYHEDRITVSEIFRDAPHEMLDYLVYHELLHKKIKFSYKNGKNYHHTFGFRNMEKKFENAGKLEKELGFFIAKKKRAPEKRKGIFSIFDFK
jgi:hypothetical protein